MKKLFAVLAVFALAAVGCDDKKSSNKPGDKTNATYVQTNKAETVAHTDVTHTKVVATETAVKTDTKVHTVEVPATKTTTPPADKPKGDGK